MAVSCQYVLQCLREFLPPRFALQGDPTGLQVGTAAKDIERVLCTLDLTLDVAAEAVEIGAGLVVSHHAVVYRPLHHLRTDQARGRILETLIKGDVAVYVPHTALDVVAGGLNDRLADAVGLVDRTFLKATGRDETTLHFLRAMDEGLELAQAARDAGATAVHVSEGLLEALVPQQRAERFARRLEDKLGESPRIVPLASHTTPRGIGRIGVLPRPELISELGARLKGTLGAPGVRVAAADPSAPVRKVAVLCGDGRSFVDAAIFAGADAMITGDIDHHTALDARARGLAMVDVGHWASEAHAAEILASALRQRLVDKPVDIVASQRSTQPFAFI